MEKGWPVVDHPQVLVATTGETKACYDKSYYYYFPAVWAWYANCHFLNKNIQTNTEEFLSVKHQNEILPNLSMFVSCCHCHSCPGRRNVAVFFAGALWHLAEEASRKTDIGNAVLGLVPGPYVSFMALVLGWGLGWVRIGWCVWLFFPTNTSALEPPSEMFFCGTRKLP